MPKAISLREDSSAEELRELASRADDAKQARRLLALASIREGKSRSEAARLGAMQTQILRDWVIVFNQHGPSGLVNTPPPGRPPKLNVAQKQAISALVEAGPDPEVDGVVRWRCGDLKTIIHQRYEVDLDEVTVGRLLKELGFAHWSTAPISARPQHPRQDAETIEAFKKKRFQSGSPR